MPQISWNIEGFPHEIFRHCETKKSSTENSDILFLCINFSRPEIFWNTEVFSNEIFRYWDKKIWTKSFAYNIEIIGGLDVCRKPSKTRF